VVAGYLVGLANLKFEGTILLDLDLDALDALEPSCFRKLKQLAATIGMLQTMIEEQSYG
jgi:hypothetical protein